jgi:hypothetical protein
MRSFAICFSLLIGAVTGACSFEPNIPKGSLLCQESRECPRGYLCDQVLLAADRRVWTCCAQPGCADLTPQEREALIGMAVARASDAGADTASGVDAPTRASCGNDKVEPGETCDPPGTCPTSCPPSGCMRRKLEGSTASCTARCVEDTPQTACMTGDSCCPAGCAGMDEDCSCTCGNSTVEASCGEKCDPVGSCPASCPNVACMKRKLLNAGGCQAECVDDGVETACMNGDGCCPPVCNSTTDTDCTARCGNGVREGNEKCDGTDCPASCPAMGCQRRKLQGSAAQCDAECVNDEVISVCGNGDGCCPPACNRNNDAECTCSCGNGIVEAACGEKCEGAGCPGSCPPQGCQLRKLQGTACTAECVPDGMRTTCANGDGCCPGGCTANNDNDCQPRCGNGAVEAGETCDPSSVCRMQSDACTSDANFVRTRSGNVNSCTFRCTSVARTCSGTSDGACPTSPMCAPCGASCGPGQDVDCKLPIGAACTASSQCTIACVDGRCCESTCTGQCRSCAVIGMMGTCRPLASGFDTNSTPACSGNNTCANGSCLLGPGQPCTAGTQCASGTCTTFFRDADADGLGSASMTARVCGTTPPAGHVTVAGDCCDSDNRVNPNQSTFFEAANNCGNFDYNCNSMLEQGSSRVQKCDLVDCRSGWATGVPTCGVEADYTPCVATQGGAFCDIHANVKRRQTCR